MFRYFKVTELQGNRPGGGPHYQGGRSGGYALIDDYVASPDTEKGDMYGNSAVPKLPITEINQEADSSSNYQQEKNCPGCTFLNPISALSC